MKNKLLLLLLFFSVSSFASSCLLSNALKDKDLNSDPKFWEEYSKLVSTGKSSDEAIKTIRARLQNPAPKAPTVAPSLQTASVSSPRRFSFNKRAEQEMSKLPKNLQKKVDEFLDIALNPRGFAQIRDNPGRWHWEKLKQFGPDAQSVRLNGGYRILFDLKGDQIVIREINKGHIHGS